MQELYHHALADYYQRSAEMSRQAAAARPPLLGRLLSWVGRFFDRLVPGPRAATVLPPPPAPGGREFSAPAARSPLEASTPAREASLAAGAVAKVASPREASSPRLAAPPANAASAEVPAKSRRGAPPVLQVIFADQDGVHVIWQLAAPLPAHAKDRDRANLKEGSPKLEFTYSLDSSTARRLQDCYGQLAQLGYKIAGLDAVRTPPEKSASKRESPEAAKSPKPGPTGKTSAETLNPSEPQSPPRKVRPEVSAPPPESVKSPVPEPQSPDPSFLPGM